MTEIALHPILQVKMDMTSPARTPRRQIWTQKKRGDGSLTEWKTETITIANALLVLCNSCLFCPNKM